MGGLRAPRTSEHPSRLAAHKGVEAMRKLVLALMAFSIAASGCGTAPPIFPEFNNLANLRVDDSSKKIAAAGQDFDEAIKFCREVLNFYERKARGSAERKLWIGGIGAVAGGVIAPSLAAGHAARTAIGAWSGISGVTSSLLTDLGKGAISEEFYIHERRMIARNLRDRINDIAKEKDPEQKVNKSRVLAATCVASELSIASTEVDSPAPPETPALATVAKPTQ